MGKESWRQEDFNLVARVLQSAYDIVQPGRNVGVVELVPVVIVVHSRSKIQMEDHDVADASSLMPERHKERHLLPSTVSLWHKGA